jgi:hypothetical protein
MNCITPVAQTSAALKIGQQYATFRIYAIEAAAQ